MATFIEGWRPSEALQGCRL